MPVPVSIKYTPLMLYSSRFYILNYLFQIPHLFFYNLFSIFWPHSIFFTSSQSGVQYLASTPSGIHLKITTPCLLFNTKGSLGNFPFVIIASVSSFFPSLRLEISSTLGFYVTWLVFIFKFSLVGFEY